MLIEQFHIEIENGKVLFKSLPHKELFDKFVAQFPDGKYTLEITTKKSKRSGEQNRYYFFYLGLIESETGNDKEVLHSYFKNKFLTTEITELYGDKVRVAKSTTELSRGEFCEYLVKISELSGVELPDTTAYFGSSYHK